MSRRHEASRHSPHELVTGPTRRGEFVCTHPAAVARHPLVVEHTVKHCNRAETQKVHAGGPVMPADGDHSEKWNNPGPGGPV